MVYQSWYVAMHYKLILMRDGGKKRGAGHFEQKMGDYYKKRDNFVGEGEGSTTAGGGAGISREDNPQVISSSSKSRDHGTRPRKNS